jgi:DNA-binding MarR family transcriptional regulator
MRAECTSYAEKLAGLFSQIVDDTLAAGLLRELDDLEITVSQLQALTCVAECGSCTVGALAEALRVTHPAAVRLAEKLVRKELLTRRVADGDHRQTELRVLPAGRRLVQRVWEERAGRLERVLDRMEVEDRQSLIRGLEGFVTAALEQRGALDALCVSCQAVHPTECDDFRVMMSGPLSQGETIRGG